MEEWKNIEGYDGLYKVSNLGRVKSLGNEKTRKEKILKTGKTKDGYLQVGLHKEGKRKKCYVHRLVAQAFIENPNNFNEVNHIDENKENNISTNLEWCTGKSNCNHGSRNEKIRVALSKRVKCKETGIIYASTHQAQRKTGVSQGNISSCCNGRYKTAGGYHWQYI